MTITSENSDGFKGIDPLKMVTYSKVMHEQAKTFYDHLDLGIDSLVYCRCNLLKWANKVFPDKVNNQEAIEALWKAIYHVCYVDKDPLNAWKCIASFLKNVKTLNEMSIDYLHYTNSLELI